MMSSERSEELIIFQLILFRGSCPSERSELATHWT